MFFILSLVQASGLTEEIRKTLSDNKVDVDELIDIQRELLEGFAERKQDDTSSKIKYIWHKEH